MVDPTILERHIQSLTDVSMGLPGFPPDHVQMQYVGSCGEAALREIWPFFVKANQSVPLDGSSRVVDFGVGWGRIARLFHESHNLMFLADISEEALSFVRSQGVRGIPIKIREGSPMPLDPVSVSLVYSYSVFSHISEASAIFWINDIHRILKPGGAFLFTAQSMRFLNLVYACNANPNPTDIERVIGTYIADPELAMQRFNEGKHVFTGGGGRDSQGLSVQDYGWAAIPRAWLESVIAGKFVIEELCDEPANLTEQDIYVLRRL